MTNYALVGASADPKKYGYQILEKMVKAGYTVYPINLNEITIQGLLVYKQLEDVKQVIDIVIFVVPPIVTIKILPIIKKLGIKQIWLQPGSESSEVISICQQETIDCIHHRCIMIDKKLI